MIDVLIPLDNGSRYENMELKYCLRSIEKYLTGVRNVWVVGEQPLFINWANVIHVPYKDNTNNWRRAHNIYGKIMAGINFTEAKYVKFNNGDEKLVHAMALTDSFLFMNDDHFLLNEYDAARFPYYHRGHIFNQDYSKNQPQLTQMANTVYELLKNPTLSNKNLLDYSIHCPILYHKASFRALTASLPDRWPEHGYEVKSFYANSDIIGENVYQEDLKFREPMKRDEIYKELEGRDWFSTGDKALRGFLPEVLEELYPNKSIYEV